MICTGIHGLRYNAYLLHRDVSESNIMYTERDGKEWFILIDFDQAARVDEAGQPLGATSRHRTGTLPFMAYELLIDMHKSQLASGTGDAASTLTHCVLFDYQSLFWVCLWCAIKIVAQNTKDRHSVQAKRCATYLIGWESGTYQAMSSIKESWLRNPAVIAEAPLSPLFEGLRSWFSMFQDLFSDGMYKIEQIGRVARDAKFFGGQISEPTFTQYERMHGAVTRDTILKKFDQYEMRVAARQTRTD